VSFCILLAAFALSKLVLGRQVLRQHEKRIRKRFRDKTNDEIIKRQAEQESQQRACGEACDQKLENELTLEFDKVGPNSAWVVGGKGANLGFLSHNDLPVPNGFCVTRAAYVASHDPTGLEQVKLAVKRAYDRIDDGQAVVAVRSSATCEDSKDASFAGQLETYLGIRGGEQVMNAVEKCWNSMHLDHVTAYRTMAGNLNEQGVACCVVVQKMVEARCAGVLFTANPVTKSGQEMVITASWGLGEAVVSDLVTPDTWVVDASSGNILRSEISPTKDKMYIVNTAGYNGSIVVDVEPIYRPSESCLSDRDINSLIAAGKRVCELYKGSPCDIEWAIDHSGSMYLLQARPITTLSDAHAEDNEPTINEFDAKCRDDDWVTTANAQEMFPKAGTPLSISTFGRAANYALQAMHCAFGVREDINEEEMVVGWFHGLQFLNMTNTLRLMIGGMIGGRMAKENGEMSILGRINKSCTVEDIIKSNSPEENRSTVRRLLNGVRYVATMLLAIPVRVPRLRARVTYVRSYLSQHEDETMGTLWKRIDAMIDDYLDQWTDGVIVSSTSAAAMLLVMKLLCVGGHYSAWDTGAVADVSVLIASGEGEMTAESCDAVKSLDDIADVICKSKQEAHRFAHQSIESALDAMRNLDAFRVLLERHGHRCIKESELRSIEWAADPRPLIIMLQKVVKARLSKSCVGSQRKNNDKTEEIISTVPSLVRPFLKLAIRCSRSGIRHRELGKSLCIAFHTELKKAYRRLGSYLQQSGRIPEADLVFFLTHDELGLVTRKSAPRAIITRLRLRAMKRRRLLPSQDRLVFPVLSKGKPEPENPHTAHSSGLVKLQGTPVCTGDVIGRARVVYTVEEAELIQSGEILVCPQTDVGWTPFFSLASGLVTEIGGLLSHGAVVAREYGLPCIVNVGTGACAKLSTGQLISMRASDGTVTVLSKDN